MVVIVCTQISYASSGPMLTITSHPSFDNKDTVLKPNSLTYNFVEVSTHNLETSQTWGFCMDFLNHKEEIWIFYQVFLLSPLQSTVH